LPDNFQGVDSARLQEFESEAPGFFTEPTRASVGMPQIVHNIIQNWVTRRRLKIGVGGIKRIRSRLTEMILVAK
jgi:hypothetical protein